MGRARFSKVTRYLAMERAHHRCERCGETEHLTLHHIHGRTSSSILNAMVLCVECHFWKHHTRRRHHK
jgi:hypothetical protein